MDPESEARPRLEELRRRMDELGMDAVLVAHPRDVLYYAGTARPATLVVTPTEAALFVRRGLELARREATVRHVEGASGFAPIGRWVAGLGRRAGVLGTELDLVPGKLCERIRAAFPSWALADASPSILAQRAIKDEAELDATRRAAVLADAGMAAVPAALAAGGSELDVAAEVELALRRGGHELGPVVRHPGAAGPGVMVMSGENLTVQGGYGLVVTGSGLGASMPYGPAQRPLEKGDLVVVDLGATLDGYNADLARTFVVGAADPWQQALFEVVREAEDAVLSAIRPGVTCGGLFEVAAAVVERAAPPRLPSGSLSLPGFVGHGLGLEMDEPPVLAAGGGEPLAAGMVLAVEIEVSDHLRRTMAKLEDTVAVVAGGCRLLTDSPRDLIRG